MDKFKEKEQEFRQTLPKQSYAGLRLDGKAFHSFTQGFERPYDLRFMKAMDEATLYVVKELFPSAMFAYTQSDEISILFTDTASTETQFPFNGKVEKLLSVSASAATGGFMKALPTREVPMFDARLFVLETKEEAKEYVMWRRNDARKNAISMACETLYSPKELHKKTTAERVKMLESSVHKNLPSEFLNGRLFVPEMHTEEVHFVDQRTQEHQTVTASRRRWVKYAADMETMVKKLKIKSN